MNSTPNTYRFLGLTSSLRQLLSALLSLILCSAGLLAAQDQDAIARTWTPEPKKLSSAIKGTDPFTYEFVCSVTLHDPCDFGIEWKAPRVVREVVVDYATLNRLAYQPAVDWQSLQYWDGASWQRINAALEVDYRNQAEFAPVHGSGTVRWTYRFPPVTTSRMRVLVTRPQNPDPGFRLCTVRRFSANEGGEGDRGGRGAGIRILGKPTGMPEWLEPNANLAIPAAGAEIIPGNPAEVRWPHRLMVNFLRVSPAVPVTTVEWWDGASWRTVEVLDVTRPGDARFLPIATARLRLRATQPVRQLEAHLDSEASRYFREVEESRVDTLGMRFRSQPRADLAAMQGLLLSLDFGKAAIGLPADLHETIVMSSGAFVITEPPQTDPVQHALVEYDRWFAFALGPEKHALGTDWMRIERRYADGYLPAIITTYPYKGLHYEERVHVTIPGDEPYGTVAEMTVANRSTVPVHTALTLATGRLLNSWGPTNKFTPFFQDIGPTGYTMAADRQTVLSPDGGVILYAQTPGAWEGTPRV